MDRLGATQLDLLARHRARSLDLLLTASAAYRGGVRLRDTPDGKAILAQPPDMLVSIAISAAAAAVERRRLESATGDRKVFGFEAVDTFPAEVLSMLRRRRLPFSQGDVRLLLDLGTFALDRELPIARSLEPLSFAVTAAERLLDAETAPSSTLVALERAGQAIEALGVAPRSAGGALRRRIRALTATQVPGGLLDLLILDPRDAWAEPAKEILRTHAERWEGTQALVALLARARSTRPTEAWRREAAAIAARYDGLGELLRALLEPVIRVDLSSSGIASPPAWLLAPDNEAFVRGAIWATAEVGEPWVVPLLGQLALRGAAPSPHPTVTIALSRPVASAAVETLGMIGTPEATRELRTLLAEIRRRDLLRRIAAIVGEPTPETHARDERIRREKRRAVQRRADPEPQERQRLATAAVRRDLAPLLRQSGFSDSAGRTFWRALDDRVEVIHCKAHSGGLTLELGLWFRFVPRRAPVPERDGRPRPTAQSCDVLGNVHAWDGNLRVAGEKAVAWFARWRQLSAVLRWLLVGSPSDAVHTLGPRGSATHALLTGYVAMQLDETAVARRYLGLAAASYREQFGDRHSPQTRGDDPGWDAWVARLEADAALTGATARPDAATPPPRQPPPGAPPVP